MISKAFGTSILVMKQQRQFGDNAIVETTTMWYMVSTPKMQKN